MATNVVMINRAPVMTLWGQVVAERLGYDHDAALTMGKVVAGLNAQAKGQRLGIYEPAPAGKKKRKAPPAPGEVFTMALLGREISVQNTQDGPRALASGKPVSPASIERYLTGKFGDDLDTVRAALTQLAQSFSPDELQQQAYDLYARFRPTIASGTRGWGQKGALDLDVIRSMAKRS